MTGLLIYIIFAIIWATFDTCSFLMADDEKLKFYEIILLWLLSLLFFPIILIGRVCFAFVDYE